MTKKNPQDFLSRVDRIVGSDDKYRFVKLLKEHPSEVTNSLVNKCVDLSATKCLFALLRVEVCGQFPALDHEELPQSGVTCLAYVARSNPDPKVINLMLTQCGAIPLANVPCTIGLVQGLPIHFLLVNLSFVDHIYKWRRGESIIKLIILLCQWKTKPILDSARLLAQHTDSINDVAWTFLKHGGLEQFVALLLVAQEKVMAPFDSGLAIRQCITSEIDSLSKDDIDTEEEVYKSTLKDALQVLDVFERVGKDLSLYCSSMVDYVHVEDVLVDVSDLLKKSDVHVTIWDLSICSQFVRHRGLRKLNLAKMAGPHDDSCLHIRPTRYASLWPGRYDPYFRGASGGYCGKGGMITFHKLMSLGSQQPKRYRPYSTACNGRNFSTCFHLAGAAISPGQISKSLYRAGVATSAMQISNSSHNAVAGSFPRQLAHFTMKLMKAFKLL